MTPTVEVTAMEDGTDLLGKTAEDLQYGITMKGNKISGNLKHVTGYTGFSSKPDEQEGHYLAMKYTPSPEDAEVHVTLVNGTVGERTLDEDHILITRITNPSTQKIKVRVTTEDGESEPVIYDISGLVLEE